MRNRDTLKNQSTRASGLSWALLCAFGLAVCAIFAGSAVGKSAPSPSVRAGAVGSQLAAPSPTLEVYDPNKIVPTATPTLLPQATREALFEDVWTTVDYNYLYEDYHGVDWDKIYDEYQPKAMSATRAVDYYKALEDMILELKDDHSAFLPPPSARYERDFANGTLDYAGIGITDVYTDNSLLVLYTYPGSPAAKSGIRPRDRIKAIDDQQVSKETGNGAPLAGLVDTKVHVTVRSPEQQPRDLTLTREVILGSPHPSIAQLQADPTIAYLRVPTLFVHSMGAQVEHALTDLDQRYLLQDVPLKGLVLDLRYNGGGWGTVLNSILGQFTWGNLGTFTSVRSAGFPLDVKKSDLYERFKAIPLVVLVDAHTQSYAEVLAASLQSKGRVKVVGTQSAGNTETVELYDLADGSRLALAQYAFNLPDGTNLEGRGVTPDVAVNKNWTNYTESDDPDILAAVNLLHQFNGR